VDTVEVENVIVGAGVLGLAIGAELARKHIEVFLLEKSRTIGSGISSRNSEVIHSGIYYPSGSLRHLLCVEGRRLLYAYCSSRNVAHRQCGKLVVATSNAETSRVESIAQQAKRNGVEGVQLFDGREARLIEPGLKVMAALHVPDTGILDSHSYMQSLSGEIEEGGGAVLFEHEVIAGRRKIECLEIETKSPSGTFLVRTKRLILAVGLWTHNLAACIEDYDSSGVPALALVKGSYFSYSGPASFTHLIYPTPVDGGLGTHLTFDLAGRMRFGPDVEWLMTNDPRKIDFDVDPARSASFYDSVRRYWPGLPDGTLSPDYAGVRPKLSREGEPARDFVLHGPADHHIPGLVALYGIESPGLTCSLAIARQVAELLELS
jgi:L-2-hydroxyglutarate oxidase LhgO